MFWQLCSPLLQNSKAPVAVLSPSREIVNGDYCPGAVFADFELVCGMDEYLIGRATQVQQLGCVSRVLR